MPSIDDDLFEMHRITHWGLDKMATILQHQFENWCCKMVAMFFNSFNILMQISLEFVSKCPVTLKNVAFMINWGPFN